jgi:nitrogen fixation/metabolism regulation signal transduction histidine kinase
MTVVNDVELIEELISDYFSDQRRAVENSGSITPSYYTKENERLQEESYAATCALERIKLKLGVN